MREEQDQAVLAAFGALAKQHDALRASHTRLLETLERIAAAKPEDFGHSNFAQAFTAFQYWAGYAVAETEKMTR